MDQLSRLLLADKVVLTAGCQEGVSASLSPASTPTKKVWVLSWSKH